MNKRILVVEDNPANLELMTYALNAFGYEPLTAMRGEDGLALARQQAPALILCDIHMPGMDGCEFARRLRQDEALHAIPLVAVTAYAMAGDRERMLAAGFDDYLTKPIDPAALSAALDGWLALSARRGAAVPAATAQLRHPAHATILVTDDQDLNLAFKRDLLQPLGYQVLTAHDAPQGLALALEHRPDLIISDVGLQTSNGFDFLRAVRARPELDGLPFIFLTSTHWDAAMREAALQLGASRFLFRPIDPQALLAEIRACLGGMPG